MKLNKYNIIRTEEDLLALDSFLMNEDGTPKFNLLSVDTETNGLAHWKDVVIGISISSDASSGFYIPILTWIPDTSKTKAKKGSPECYPEGCFENVWSHKKYPENVTQAEHQPPEWIGEFLKRWIVDTKVSLIMHNAPFDCLMIEKNFGVDLSENLFCDTLLLKHIVDEDSSCGLKETAILWQEALGIPMEEEANKEQQELGASVIKNGGTYNKHERHIWRADLEVMGKYAIADTFLTYGIFEVGLDKFSNEFDEKHWDWFFKEEVMPLCKEVVIPMKRNGVRINVKHFEELAQETHQKLLDLEEEIILQLESEDLLTGFDKGKSVEQVANKKKLFEKIIQLEGLAYPTMNDKKRGLVKSMSKKAIQDSYDREPHWVWSYLLGEGELKYSPEKLNQIKQELFVTNNKGGRRYQFNLGSPAHLRWLYCTKLKNDPTKLPQTDSATKENPIPSMDADVLETFFLEKYPFTKRILLFAKLKKLYGTYIMPAVNLNYKGYLYMEMMQHGTISGRFSCGGGYNLQTLPKVEDLSRCVKCGSKNLTVAKPIKLLAVAYCNDCDHTEEDILCPSSIKEGFIAPEGMKIINADYSSLEPRCFAYMSGDQKIKDVYIKNLDFYSKLYCDMEDKEGKYSADPKAPNFLKKLAPEKRDMIKPVALGIPYGARDGQVANLMGFKKMVDFGDGNPKELLDVQRGKEFRDKYLSTYQPLKNYMITQEAKANAYGFVETIVGRRRHLKFCPKVFKLLSENRIDYEQFLDEKNKNLKGMKYQNLTKAMLTELAKELGFHLFDIKKNIYRDWGFVRAIYKNELNNAKNFPIQGFAAHVANRAMLDITRALKAKGIKAWVCLQVHDEITSYAPDAQLEEAKAIQQEAMERNIYTAMIDIPMIAEPIIATNLKESK